MKPLALLSISLAAVCLFTAPSSALGLLSNPRTFERTPASEDAKTIPFPADIKKLLAERQKKMDALQVDFLKQLPYYAIFIPHNLIEAGINRIGPYDLEELIKDFKKISYSTVPAFATIEVNPGVFRNGSVCVPKTSSIVVNLPTFESVDYETVRSAELLLHEALCSIPDSENLQKRKYDDSLYQISSRILALFRLVLANKVSEAINLSRDPVFTDQIEVASSEKTGGISGGPGGGNFSAVNFKIQLLLKLEEKRAECRAKTQKLTPENTQTNIKLVGLQDSLEIPCYWLTIGWIRRALYETQAEAPVYIDIEEDPDRWLAENQSIKYAPKPIDAGAIKAKIYFNVGQMYSMQDPDKFAEEALVQIFKPCLAQNISGLCFFDFSYVKPKVN